MKGGVVAKTLDPNDDQGALADELAGLPERQIPQAPTPTPTANHFGYSDENSW